MPSKTQTGKTQTGKTRAGPTLADLAARLDAVEQHLRAQDQHLEQQDSALEAHQRKHDWNRLVWQGRADVIKVGIAIAGTSAFWVVVGALVTKLWEG